MPNHTQHPTFRVAYYFTGLPVGCPNGIALDQEGEAHLVFCKRGRVADDAVIYTGAVESWRFWWDLQGKARQGRTGAAFRKWLANVKSAVRKANEAAGVTKNERYSVPAWRWIGLAA